MNDRNTKLAFDYMKDYMLATPQLGVWNPCCAKLLFIELLLMNKKKEAMNKEIESM